MSELAVLSDQIASTLDLSTQQSCSKTHRLGTEVGFHCRTPLHGSFTIDRVKTEADVCSCNIYVRGSLHKPASSQRAQCCPKVQRGMKVIATHDILT